MMQRNEDNQMKIYKELEYFLEIDRHKHAGILNSCINILFYLPGGYNSRQEIIVIAQLSFILRFILHDSISQSKFGFSSAHLEFWRLVPPRFV